MVEIFDFQAEAKKRGRDIKNSKSENGPACLFDCLPFETRRFLGNFWANCLKNQVEGTTRFFEEQKRKAEIDVVNMTDAEVYEELSALERASRNNTQIQREIRWNAARFIALFERAMQSPAIRK